MENKIQERPCPVCGKYFPETGFLGHIAGAHKLNSERFAQQYPAEPPVIKNVRKVVSDEKKEKIASSKVGNLEGSVLEGLNSDELDYFHSKVEEIFLQIDRDNTQKPRIYALVNDYIVLMRYQKLLLNPTRKDTINKDLNQAVKEVESRIESKMKSLGIDRQSKVANRQQLRSTPSCLISAYTDEIQRQPAEVLETLSIEEDRALADVQAILDKYYFPNAADIEPLHLGNGNDPGKSNYVPPSLDAIVQRAGVEL